jgi:hypothetical protein
MMVTTWTNVPGFGEAVVYPLSFNSHVRQVLVGFARLAAGGQVKVRFDASGRAKFGVEPKHFLDDSRLCVVVEIGGRHIVFDVHDTADLFEPLLRIADVYFKRSYSRALHGALPNVRPYGLNYGVELEEPWPTGAMLALRLEPGRHSIREAWRALDLPGCRHTVVSNLLGTPEATDEPRVMFMTRVWDPDDRNDRPNERREERRQISLMRVACIVALQDRFGARFTGGLQPSRYAVRNWPDLVADSRLCERHNFLAELDRHDVCVATDGLYGSVGWKLAEYVAKSRAIVSEPLRYELIGSFTEGTNYLSFESPDECVRQVQLLVEDKRLRSAMMRSNSKYFAEYGLPERLVYHALSHAASA